MEEAFFTETGAPLEYEDIVSLVKYIKKRYEGELESEELINYYEDSTWKKIMNSPLNSN